MELELPNFSLGRAFHWIPVRSTNTIAAKTFRGSIGFRPASDFRRIRLSGAVGFGRSGETMDQKSSEISHDWSFRVASMAGKIHFSSASHNWIYG